MGSDLSATKNSHVAIARQKPRAASISENDFKDSRYPNKYETGVNRDIWTMKRPADTSVAGNVWPSHFALASSIGKIAMPAIINNMPCVC